MPTTFEVIKNEYYRMAKIVLHEDEVIVESGAMHFMRGNIEIISKLPSVGGFFKAMVTNEKAVRPRYKGTGELYLEPTLAEINVLEVKGEEWILDKGAFLASSSTIEVGVFTNKAMSGLFGGEGFFQTKVSGQGTVLFVSQGPVQRIDLNNDKLVVDGSFAVARTGKLEFAVEKATKKLFGTMTSGEGLVNTFKGTGTVLIAPVPNHYMATMDLLGEIYSAQTTQK